MTTETTQDPDGSGYAEHVTDSLRAEIARLREEIEDQALDVVHLLHATGTDTTADAVTVIRARTRELEELRAAYACTTVDQRRLPPILVLSRSKAEAYTPRDSAEVCISIRSRTTLARRLSPSFAAILHCEFDDVAPDTDRAQNITRDEARRLVAFALQHRRATRLVIHCDAGASRSVSVAAALQAGLAGFQRCVNQSTYWRVRDAIDEATEGARDA